MFFCFWKAKVFFSKCNALHHKNHVTGKNTHHSRVAMELVKKYPLFGCGGWGYKHLSLNLMEPDELRTPLAIGSANVHNDYLQFLCEHGAIGLGCLVGETIIRVHGGQWETDDDDPKGEVNITVRLPDGSKIWPVQRCMKRLANGPEDNIHDYVMVMTGNVNDLEF